MRRLVLVVLLAIGCAGNYYGRYKAANPDWDGVFPARGGSLAETLAGLYAPPVAAYSRFVTKLDVVRIGADGSGVLMTQAEIDRAIESGEKADFGVVATLGCLSEVDQKRYKGEKVAWYLLPGNRLGAYDHYDFVDRCIVSNEFRPAPAERAALEHVVTAHRDAFFPQSMVHVGEYYQKGIAYLSAHRTADAAAMLKAGDEAFDVSERGERHIDMKNAPSAIEPMRSGQIDRLRTELADGIARANQVSAASASTGAPQP